MSRRYTKRSLGLFAAFAIIIGAGLLVVRSSNATSNAIPTAEVRKQEFVEYLQIRGEIKAQNSKQLTAPSSSGDLQLVKLLHTGAQVKKDDVVAQFDTTTLQRTLEQKRTDLNSAEAEIKRIQAQGHMTEEQNLTDSLSAKYNVERSKLDVSKQEILSEIDGEKTKLSLLDSQQKLTESEQKLQSGRDGVNADVAAKKKKRDKALFDVQLAEKQIAAMTLRAPTDGIVTLFPNFRASMGNGVPPDFKEGDRAWPGAVISEIPDLSSIRFEARIDETDRGRLKSNETAIVRVDAVPDREFTARIRDISTLAKIDFSGGWPPIKNFAIRIDIDNTDPRIRPGMSATCRVPVNRMADSIVVPAEAVFQKDGQSVVYVSSRKQFEPRKIQVGRRNANSVQVVSGVNPGERVALKDPTEVSPSK